MSQLHPNLDIDQANQELKGKSPEEIVAWALSQAKNPIITTNFRPYESAILHLVAKQRPDITVLWVDSGYNTDATYQFANKLIRDLDLNVVTYIPKQTAAHRDSTGFLMRCRLDQGCVHSCLPRAHKERSNGF